MSIAILPDVSARGRRLRRAGAAAILAAVLAMLTACTGIPSSGPVHQGLSNLDQAERSVQFNPSRPTPGASQEDIVRGFVRAASSAADDYAIAREFLAPTYAGQWDPSLGVTVDEGTQQYSSPEENTGVLTLSVVAQLDAQGKFVPAAPGTSQQMHFELVSSDGEWRISSAPAGIILDRGTFMSAWTAKQVYYLTADGLLVSDARWFLNRTTLLSTQIVAALLDGPSDSMGEVLHSAFPDGTTLIASGVPVVNGAARIDLSPELLDADAQTMEELKQQLAASLQSVPGVSRFELTVNNTLVEQGPVAVSDLTGSSVEAPYVSVLKDGVFGALTGSEVKELPGIGPRVVELGPKAVTLALERDAAAVLHGGGVSWADAATTVKIDARPGLLEPSLDRYGYVWTFSRTAGDAIVATRPGEQGASIEMPWLDGRLPTSIRVSKGGSRIAVLLAAASGDEGGLSEVLVAGVVRDGEGRPVALSGLAPTQLWAAGAPLDLDWVDENRFAALTRVGSVGRVTIGVMGQFPLEPSDVIDGSAVSGSGTRQLLRVLDDEGHLFGPQGSGWQLQASGVSLVAKVG